MRNLILTGGLYHPFEAASETLRDVLEQVGFTSDITTDIPTGLSWLDDGNYDLLTVYALRWPMLAERFANDRALWAVTLSDADKGRIHAHLAAGKGLLALHTAAICFDDWPRWRDIVGAGWIWGTSNHPPHGPVRVEMTNRPHPITQGLDSFGFAEEAYARMDLVPGIEPLATVQASVQTAGSPALWAREVETVARDPGSAWHPAGLQPSLERSGGMSSARVVYDALGHDSDSLNHPTHRRIVQRAALWATRQSDAALARV